MSILRVEAAEFLHALAGVHFRGVDVALPVDGDVVQGGEHADLATGTAEAGQRLLAGTIDDAHFAVHTVDHVDVFLLLVRREHEIVDRSGAARRLSYTCSDTKVPSLRKICTRLLVRSHT